MLTKYLSYATTVFKAYNGRIKTWSFDRFYVFDTLLTVLKLDRYTFNEPRVYCAQIAGYPFSGSF